MNRVVQQNTLPCIRAGHILDKQGINFLFKSFIKRKPTNGRLKVTFAFKV